MRPVFTRISLTGHTDMEVNMPVQAGAEPVDVDLGFCQSDCANVQRRLVPQGSWIAGFAK